MTPRQLSKLLDMFSTAGYQIDLPYNFTLRNGFAVLENAEKEIFKLNRAFTEQRRKSIRQNIEYLKKFARPKR